MSIPSVPSMPSTFLRSPTMHEEEHDLESRASAGDEKALTDLLERHAPEVRRRLTGSIPERWQAIFSLDDIMQQAFLDAFLSIRSFRPQPRAGSPRSPHNDGGAFTAWLVTLARHNLLDTIKALEAEKRGGGRRRIDLAHGDDSFADLFEWLGGVTSTPSRVVARVEAKSVLSAAIERLPQDYRRVVQEYDLEGRPIEDVSASLSRSQGATYMLRARAHRMLAELLGTASQYLSKVP